MTESVQPGFFFLFICRLFIFVSGLPFKIPYLERSKVPQIVGDVFYQMLYVRAITILKVVSSAAFDRGY